MIHTVNNYTSTVNLMVPYGFPLRLEIAVTGYTLSSLSSGRLLIRGPGRSRSDIVNTIAYTIIDLTENKYIVNVPVSAPGYSSVLEGRPYTWSFDGDVDVFRLQGDFRALYDTGQSPGKPDIVDVAIGSLSIDVSFMQGSAAPSPLAEKTVIPGVSGTALSGHRIVYTDGNSMYYADNTVPAHVDAIVGMTNTATSGAGEAVYVVTSGVMTEPSWSFSVPSNLYLGTAGNLLTSPPLTGWLVKIGRVFNTTSIIVDIGEPVKLL